MTHSCLTTVPSSTDAELIALARAAGTALSSAFAASFDIWTLAPGSTRWAAVRECPRSSQDDQTVEALKRLVESRPRGAHEPILVEQGGGRILLGLPLGEADGHLLAATATIEDSPGELARKLGRLFLSDFRVQKQLSQFREDLDSCAAQIADDFEELVFLRRLVEYLDMSEISSGIWHVAKAVLPRLAALVRAESLVLVTARQESDNFSQVRAEGPLAWVGPAQLNDESCRRFIEKYRRAALGRPVVNNCLDDTSEKNKFPGIHRFVMVSVTKGQRMFGWLVAINLAHEREAAPESRLWQLSQFEFGTKEAGLLSAVASMLATHARNVELFREKEALIVGIVRAMVSAIDAKDPYTCGHSERVALVGRCLGKHLGLAEEDCERLYLAGLLHDLGKLGVPDVVLKKPGRLSDEEMDQIRPHPERGWAILQDLDQLQDLVPEILHHHERYDGTGYPDGLAGDAIPLMAQVLAVADAYDAMVSNRPYRKGMLHKKAESILREGSGSQWNPKVIDTFFRNVSEIRTLWSTHRPQAPRRRRPDKASGNRADPPNHKKCESGV